MQAKVGVHNIEKKKGDVNVNMQTKVGVGVRLRLGWDRDRWGGCSIAQGRV